VLAQIDDFIFDLNSINGTNFENFKRTITYRFSSTQLLGNHDSHKPSGLHEESIEIKGTLIAKSQNQLKDFEKMAEEKLPRTLVFGDGTCKTILILGLELDRSSFLKDGAFIKQVFKIDIVVDMDGYSFENT
jgi:phage protein U